MTRLAYLSLGLTPATERYGGRPYGQRPYGIRPYGPPLRPPPLGTARWDVLTVTKRR